MKFFFALVALCLAATVLAEGMGLQILTEGNGSKPSSGQKVTVNYIGTLASNGQKFDSSYDRNQPFSFTLGQGQVIPCWDQGVAKMSIGETAMLHCPADLAYGSAGAGGVIPPNAALNFKVSLLSFE